MSIQKLTDEDVRRAIERQRAGASAESLARELGVRSPGLRRRMRRLGHEPTDRRFARGPEHHNWNGGARRRADGYVRVALEPDDPMYPMASVSDDVLEHRLVMARAIGRPLTRTETVHHLNGNRADNRLENLQLRRGRHGKGIVLRCARCGSSDLVEQTI